MKDYKKILEGVVNIISTTEKSDIGFANICSYIGENCPELKESEDEKVRKEIVEYLKKNLRLEWATWLEKQGECHISHDDEIMIEQLTEYFTTGRGLQNTNETVVAWLNDVKEKLEKQGKVESDNDDIEAEEKGIRKAFNKIWEEKQDKQKSQRMISAEAKEAMYDKPADTVEQKCDESETKIFDAPTPFEDKLYAFVAACEFLTLPSKIEFIKEHSQELLDAAKEQIEKEETEWTKEDEHTLQGVIDEIQANKNQAPDYDLATYDRFLSWLKSLKNRVQPQPKQEWNEWDRILQDSSISYLCNLRDTFETKGWDKEQIQKCINWLQSLSSQTTWKPSDEQMAILYKYAEQNNYDGSILTSLYNDLKKLKLREE